MSFNFIKVVLIVVIFSSASVVNTAHAGLISVWNLNGNYADTSGNGHHGKGFGRSLPSSVSDITETTNRLSTSFNNRNYIALNQSFSGVGSLPELSASAWFKTTATGNWTSNWALLDFDRSEFFNMFVTGNGEIGFSTKSRRGINDMFSLTTGLNDGKWHHMTVTYGADTGKNIFIDGILDSSRAYRGALGTAKTRYGFIGDGSEASSYNGKRNGRYYDGSISEVKLWDNALSAQEVRAQVPEPSTFAIFALGVIGLFSRKIKKHV